MPTLNSTTGVVSETPSSPYTASDSAGKNGVLLAAESTGQYVYLLSQSVSITDGTVGATIYYTTDGSTPSTSSPVYSAPFSLTSATIVEAMAIANGYNNSSSTSASFKFRTPAATYPITSNVTATASNSTKLLQLNPIALTLIVN